MRVAWVRYKDQEVQKTENEVTIYSLRIGESFIYNNKKYKADSWSGIDSDFRYCIDEDGNVVKFSLMQKVIVSLI